MRDQKQVILSGWIAMTCRYEPDTDQWVERDSEGKIKQSYTAEFVRSLR